MRKILIPTDFSENALNAIKYGLELFKYELCEIYLIHAYSDEVYNTKGLLVRAGFEELKLQTFRNSEKELEKLEKEILLFSPNPKHRIITLSKFEILVDAVNDLADKENIDIIIMGTRGKSNDKKLTFGSNTLQVVKYVKCPVLAVPNTFKNGAPSKILFPTDYLLPYKRREIKLLSTMANSFAARIVFLHISKFEQASYRQQDNKTFLESCVEDNKTEFMNIKGGDLTATINNQIKSNGIDMVVMVNSRHSYLESMLYTSTIDKMGLHLEVPFLILQNLQRY
ncbi:nucleotide-binding universal stress UspA family protein [Gillisia sp. Hel_I_86]|uniref:universal stress protein n=1 Tax=Gillisia sp. Hel_I_86 TaxID=1249981 RepID=UPI001199CD6C|nr:universal stress protein [Gillisia sp. Hel_I_86]TVZ27564.1 nucleotide-binding universal stress UspA family protein [Gillisia sp. Hel_I_86]